MSPELAAKALTNVRLKPHKALRGCDLVDLGRVNVFCGRNNSGKSTVLEALNTADLRTEGIRLTDDQRENLLEKLIEFTGARDRNTRQRVSGIGRDVLSTQQVWFLDAMDGLNAAVQEALREGVGLTPGRWQSGKFIRAFEEQITNKPLSVMLPAKRRLELASRIDTDAVAQADGTGVLNALFRLRTQAAGSAEDERFKLIADAFAQVTDGYRFQIVTSGGSNIRLQFLTPAGTLLDASDCGQGLQDSLLLLYFAFQREPDLILIEEAENHLHADLQRRLLFLLRHDTNKQFYITTHSNVFLDGTLVDRVFFTAFRDGQVAIDDATGRAVILSELGYSVTDNLVADVIVLVEGPKDRPVVSEMLAKLGVDRTHVVKVWPLGGDIMAQVDLTVFTQDHRVVALIDQDPGSGKARKQFEEKCAIHGIKVTRLKRRAIENYFTVAALRAVFGKQIPAELTAVDPDKLLKEQLGGIDVKKNNHKIAHAMKWEDVAGTDLGDFLEDVQRLCET